MTRRGSQNGRHAFCAICRSAYQQGNSTAWLFCCCLCLKPVLGCGLVVQVQHLELLAKLYTKRMAYENAAQVYQVLASRRSGVADQAVSLAQRQEAYQNAVLQVPLPAGCLGAHTLVLDHGATLAQSLNHAL